MHESRVEKRIEVGGDVRAVCSDLIPLVRTVLRGNLVAFATGSSIGVMSNSSIFASERCSVRGAIFLR